MGGAVISKSFELPDDVEQLKALVIAQRHRIEQLERIAFGRSSEKRPLAAPKGIHPGQGHLFLSALVADAEDVAERGEELHVHPFRGSADDAAQGGSRANGQRQRVGGGCTTADVGRCAIAQCQQKRHTTQDGPTSGVNITQPDLYLSDIRQRRELLTIEAQ